MDVNSTFLGAGIGYRRAYRKSLLELQKGPALLEIIPDHFFCDPAALEPLADRYPLVFHAVGLSVSTAADVDSEAIDRIKSLMTHGRPFLFTDHLALTCSPEQLDLGHLAPVWYTKETLKIVVDRIHRWQDILNVPIAIENIAAGFVLSESDFSEAEFFAELVRQSGCGILLDLTNLRINSLNFHFDPEQYLSSLPLEAVAQIHLAGGVRHGNWWVDSHSEPVDPESISLLKSLRGRAALRAIVIERDEQLPPLADLIEESYQAQSIWEGKS